MDDLTRICTQSGLLGNPPRVSVVLPVWNGERFLAEALESLLHQTFQDFELLIVDDGSADATPAIARGFARRDPRIRILTQAHAGIAAALNAGIRNARAQYIARMDSDDVCLPTRLEKQVAYLDGHPECAVVGSGVEVLSESGEILGTLSHPASHEGIAQMLVSGSGCPLSHPAVVIRKEALHAAGGYRSWEFPCEDYALWMRLLNTGTFANIAEPLLRYRRHVGSVAVRENGRQRTLARSLVNAVRLDMGLHPCGISTRAIRPRAPRAYYHNECARFLLKSGQRIGSIRYASSSIAAAPLWLEPYAVIAACMIPMRVVRVLIKSLARLRLSARWRLSALGNRAAHSSGVGGTVLDEGK